MRQKMSQRKMPFLWHLWHPSLLIRATQSPNGATARRSQVRTEGGLPASLSLRFRYVLISSRNIFAGTPSITFDQMSRCPVVPSSQHIKASITPSDPNPWLHSRYFSKWKAGFRLLLRPLLESVRYLRKWMKPIHRVNCG